MRLFHLFRTEDVSGVSGTGRIAEGVVFHDGQVALSWFGQLHTIEIAPDIATVERIHGHEGRTEVVFEPTAQPTLGMQILKANIQQLENQAMVYRERQHLAEMKKRERTDTPRGEGETQ